MNLDEQVLKLKNKIAENEATMAALSKENVAARRNIRSFEALSRKAKGILEGVDVDDEEVVEETTALEEVKDDLEDQG